MTLRVAPSMRVRDAMIAKPIAIRASASPRELARMLIEHSISGVPVVDNDGEVVGVVSKTDLLQWCVKGGLGFGACDLLSNLADGGIGTRIDAIDLGMVADFMSEALVTAQPEEALHTAANRMTEHNVHRLIVVDDSGALQGVITSMDLLRMFPNSM